MPTKRRPVEETQAPKTLSSKERLAQKSRQKVDIPASASKDRAVIQLKGDIANMVDRLTAAIHAKKVMLGQEAACRAVVLPYAQQIHYALWMERGVRPESPQFITPSGSKFILQCKDTLCGVRGFKVPKGKDGKPVSVEAHLRANGVPADVIGRLKEKEEFNEEETLNINMPKLEKEHPNLHSKLMDLVLAANEGGVKDKDGNQIKFSDEDINRLIERNNEVTLKDDFIVRAAKYCKEGSKNDEDATARLKLLMTAIPPQWAVGSTMCADPEGVVVRLLKEDEKKEVKPTAADFTIGKYTVKQAGLNLTVFRNSDNKELVKKECDDEDHVKNAIRKWQKDPATLDQFVADNV